MAGAQDGMSALATLLTAVRRMADARRGQALALVWVGALCATVAGPAAAAGPTRLHVISDDNYPPYLFRADDGTPTGYLVDYWKLWESKTGVPVTLTATRWADAQRRVRAGEADVIDMIFRTPARELVYDFGEPYADLPVGLYTDKAITGLSSVEALQGFRIGVQAGDACIEELGRRGLKALVTYANYAELIAAAQRREVRLFCLDEFPANFYLNKAGLLDEFRKAFTLYSGQFRRAVPKGHRQTLDLVERGVAAITEAERQALADKWFGEALRPRIERRTVVLAGLVLIAVSLLVGAGFWLLRRQVAARKQESRQANMALQRSDAALTASQAQLHLALGAAQAGVWHWDLRTNFNTWSEEVWRLYGLDRSLFPGYETWKASIDDRDVAAVEAAVTAAVAERRGFEVSWRVRGSPSEPQRWLLSRGEPQFDAHGEAREYIGIVLDISGRRLAEEANELFHRAFSDSPAGQLVSRIPDGEILEVNDALCRMLDFRREELIGWRTTDFGILNQAPDRAAMMAQLQSGRAVARYDMQIRSRAGTLLDVQLSMHASVFRGVTCVFSSIIDVTRQVQAEKARALSEARLRTLVDTLPDMVWLKDPDGIYLACNRRFEAFFGRTEEQILGGVDSDFVPQEQAQTFRSRDLAAIAAGGPITNEEEVTFACDGHHELQRTVKTPVYDASGQLIGVLGIGRDITEPRRNEEELKGHRQHLEALVEQRTAELAAERGRLQQIIEATRAGTWEWNVQSGAATFNERWAQIVGYTLVELEPTGYSTWSALVHPDDLPRCVDLFERHCRGESPYYDAEHRMRHKAGHWVWVLASGRIASLTEDGQPLMLSGTHLDITRRKLAELALQDAKNAAEAAASAKSSFLANMSHEIRTPLNGVLGLAQIGLRDSYGRGRAQATFARILDSGKLLQTIVNDILDFSKIEAGKLTIESVPLDPARLVRQVSQGMAEQASAKSLPLATELQALPPAVLGDPVRMAQILYNLLSNAVKFTDRGEVRLVASTGTGPSGPVLSFAVRDTGIGIEAATLERLFQPFEQADGSFTRRFGGTGLGLVISRRLAEMMGGTIEVHSTPGQGSVFTLQLPLRQTELPVQAQGDQPVAGSLRLAGLYLLVAEDNAVNRLVIDGLLRIEGADVLLVADGRQAVEAVAQSLRPFDAVLMDVQMPVMDGLEAATTLARTHPGLPVIGQTAHAMKEEMDHCRLAGMVATVQKPLEQDLLVSTILEHVQRSAAERLSQTDRPPSPGPAPAPAPAKLPEPAPAQPSNPAIDWVALDRRYSGRRAFVERLVRLFVERHLDMPGQLRTAAAATDLAAIGRLAHELKGSAGNVMANGVVHIATSVLDRARGQDRAAIDDALVLASELDRAIEALQLGPSAASPASTPPPPPSAGR
jgi:PAS domain S-box-containing protein